MKLAGSAETPETVAKHVEVLQKEYAKRNPNMDMVTDRMVRTLELRADLYNNKPVPEILLKFPCLRDPNQVCVTISKQKKFSEYHQLQTPHSCQNLP